MSNIDLCEQCTFTPQQVDLSRVCFSLHCCMCVRVCVCVRAEKQKTDAFGLWPSKLLICGVRRKNVRHLDPACFHWLSPQLFSGSVAKAHGKGMTDDISAPLPQRFSVGSTDMHMRASADRLRKKAARTSCLSEEATPSTDHRQALSKSSHRLRICNKALTHTLPRGLHTSSSALAAVTEKRLNRKINWECKRMGERDSEVSQSRRANLSDYISHLCLWNCGIWLARYWPHLSPNQTWPWPLPVNVRSHTWYFIHTDVYPDISVRTQPRLEYTRCTLCLFLLTFFKIWMLTNKCLIGCIVQSVETCIHHSQSWLSILKLPSCGMTWNWNMPVWRAFPTA